MEISSLGIGAFLPPALPRSLHPSATPQSDIPCTTLRNSISIALFTSACSRAYRHARLVEPRSDLVEAVPDGADVGVGPAGGDHEAGAAHGVAPARLEDAQEPTPEPGMKVHRSPSGAQSEGTRVPEYACMVELSKRVRCYVCSWGRQEHAVSHHVGMRRECWGVLRAAGAAITVLALWGAHTRGGAHCAHTCRSLRS